MKKDKKQELLAKSDKELKAFLTDLKYDISKMLVDRAAGKLKNTSVIANKKKNLAIALTILRFRQLSQK